MLRNVKDQLGAWRQPIMCQLLAPARAEGTRRLTDDASNVPTQSFLAATLITDAFDAHVRTQVDGVPDTAMCTPQRYLNGRSTSSKENTGKACARVREGQLPCPRHQLAHLAEHTAELVRDLHDLCDGA